MGAWPHGVTPSLRIRMAVASASRRPGDDPKAGPQASTLRRAKSSVTSVRNACIAFTDGMWFIMAAGLLAGAPDRVKEAPLAVRRHQGPYNKDMNQVTIWAPPRPGSWQRENGLCQATCNLFWPQQAEPKEVGIPAGAQQVDPLRLGGVGSSTPGRNNQALPPAVPSAGHAAGRLALTVPCSLRCAAHGYFNAGSVAGRVVALLPAVRASAQNRLRRQHPQGPVDRLAGDRLPLPRSRPISPTEGPAARRSLAACTCPGVSRCLRPPFRPRSKSQPSGSARRQSERRNPRRHRAEWRAG